MIISPHIRAAVHALIVLIGLSANGQTPAPKKWIPAAVQNFELTGTASAGDKTVAVKSGTIQMQGEEILKGQITFATEKETIFVLKAAEPPEQKSGNYMLSGDLTFNDKTESVRFPAKIENTDQSVSVTVSTSLPDKTPVTIQVRASKASKYHPWTNSTD